MDKTTSTRTGNRTTRIASTDTPDNDSRKGASPSVTAPPVRQLGFTAPQQRSSTAPQALGAPSADFKGAGDTAQPQAAIPSSPGPLKAAVARLLKSGNPGHYIVFRNGELSLDANRPKGLGLGKPEQHKAFCKLIAAELEHMRPRQDASSAELKAFQASAGALAKAFVNRALQQLGNDIMLVQLLRMMGQLSAVYGLSAGDLDANVAILRDSANSEPPARAAQGTSPLGQSPGTRVGLAVTALLSGLALQFGLMRLHEGNLAATPFGAKNLDEVMDHIMAGGTLDAKMLSLRMVLPMIARMFDAIHEDPSLSDLVITRANLIRETLTTGHSHNDRLAGAGLCAAVLVLSLPPERLKRMFLTTQQVGQLAEEAFVVLGHLPCYVDSAENESCSPAHSLLASIGASRPEDGPAKVSQNANAFMDTPDGSRVAQRFTSALQILLHNAQRLEAFADMDDASDEQLEYESAPIFDLLQEYVPADFEHAQRIDLHARPKVETPALPLMEGPLAAALEPSMDAPPAVVRAAPPEPEVETKVAPNPPQAERQLAAARPVRVAEEPRPAGTPRFPGARRRNPAEHFHPRDHRALSRNQLRQRQEVLQARELDLIGAWDKWTPELRSLLRERSQARRMAAQGTTHIAAGQKLVQPPRLDG